jgi:hypothetical protein
MGLSAAHSEAMASLKACLGCKVTMYCSKVRIPDNVSIITCFELIHRTGAGLPASRLEEPS